MRQPSAAAIGGGLTLGIFLWGANNVGLQFIVRSWPPLWTGGSRFLLAGLILMGVLRGTSWFGPWTSPNRTQSRDLWFRGGAWLAIYLGFCNATVKFIPATHFALHMAAAPIWALLLEPKSDRPSGIRPAIAALLAVSGVLILLWPALQHRSGNGFGELLGFLSGIFWTLYSRACRQHSRELPGPVVAAQTMWRAGVWLLPFGVIEYFIRPFSFPTPVLVVQGFCILLGGVIPFALWNQALRHWPASRVFLFANLIPLATMFWARILMKETITPTFMAALILIAAGVAVGTMRFGFRNDPLKQESAT